jgi:hypothetical protein
LLQREPGFYSLLDLMKREAELTPGTARSTAGRPRGKIVSHTDEFLSQKRDQQFPGNGHRRNLIRGIFVQDPSLGKLKKPLGKTTRIVVKLMTIFIAALCIPASPV